MSPEIETFTSGDLMSTRDLSSDRASLEDTTTAIDSVALASILLFETGVHRCFETRCWRMYNEGLGMWKKVEDKLFYQVAGEILAINESQTFNDAQPLSVKQRDHLEFKLGILQKGEKVWEPNSDPHIIPFSNCVIDLRSKSVIPFDRSLKLEAIIDRDFLPEKGTDCPNWTKLLENLSSNNKEVIEVLEAVAFLSMTGRGSLERCLIHLQSDVGGAGKGTYINAIADLVAEESSVSSNLARLVDDTTLSSFEAKTLITFPEEREPVSTRSRIFSQLLKLSSRDEISGRIVHSPVLFRYRSSAMIVVASNVYLFPSDGGINRRILTVKCHPPKSEKPDWNLGNKIRDEAPMITNKLLSKFDWDPERAKEILTDAPSLRFFIDNAKESAEESSTINQFLDELFVSGCPVPVSHNAMLKNKAYFEMSSTIAYQSVQSTYEAYKQYTVINNPSSGTMKRISFEKAVISYLSLSGVESEIIEYQVPGLEGTLIRRFSNLIRKGTHPMWRNEFSNLKQ